ncbi:Ribosomal biogenesis protein gar2 [Pleurostoma richardsiae]|uniref:Ribosomal biogenesis protein gar2 n=1 Tax=Pleurostoma richardsiae TaxID=41990 RepID=A0AA38RB26_9PEZI|nr:Ribosomal biogenesis protein gar2 [Pleurostoma richardsiae]
MAAETRSKKTVKSPQASKRKAAEDVSPVTTKKQKSAPVKAVTKATKSEPAAEKKEAKKEAGKKAKGPEKKKKEKEPEPEPESESEVDGENGAVDEADDQTQALVSAIDEDAQEDDAPKGEGFKEGQAVGKIPKVKKDKKAEKKTDAAGENEEPGVVYVGGLPHGFFEHQLQEYFSQFGPVSRLRLSRNKRTGASRHYAFLEFEELSTAEVVQRTMDGYLLFGNILRCRLVPKSQVHENLWKGAGRRFKKVPWSKMAGRELEKPKTESDWARKVTKEEKRRASRAAKLKELGYEFEAPKVKGPAEVKAIAGGDDAEATKAIEAPPAAEKESEEAEEAAPAEEGAEATETSKKAKTKGSKPKKAAKAKKVKS